MGYFVLSRSINGSYYFNLKSGNGEVILTSEQYLQKQSALNGIQSVRANSPLDERYERLTSRLYQPYFTLRAANHQVIGTSQMYSSAQARDAGIASVKANGSSSDIRDHS